jgi:hypothetical protein
VARRSSRPAVSPPRAVVRQRDQFYYDDWQKEFFGDQVRRYGRDAKGWSKMVSRTPIKKMFRRAEYVPVASAAHSG